MVERINIIERAFNVGVNGLIQKLEKKLIKKEDIISITANYICQKSNNHYKWMFSVCHKNDNLPISIEIEISNNYIKGTELPEVTRLFKRNIGKFLLSNLSF